MTNDKIITVSEDAADPAAASPVPTRLAAIALSVSAVAADMGNLATSFGMAGTSPEEESQGANRSFPKTGHNNGPISCPPKVTFARGAFTELSGFGPDHGSGWSFVFCLLRRHHTTTWASRNPLQLHGRKETRLTQVRHETE